jgi:hypothetical protein
LHALELALEILDPAFERVHAAHALRERVHLVAHVRDDPEHAGRARCPRESLDRVLARVGEPREQVFLSGLSHLIAPFRR